jgi:hypothetical protein
MIDTQKISHFVKKGSEEVRLSTADLRVLEAWKPSTLTSYNAAARKYAKFKESTNNRHYTLPITPPELYAFVVWAGRGQEDDRGLKINATSLTKYLFAIKSWHTFHDVPYPYHTKARVKLMLKASGKQDAVIPPKPGKSPVLVTDLANLFRLLTGHGPEAETIQDLAVVAFWGMARIGELTHQATHGPIGYRSEPTNRDVRHFTHVTTIDLHQAKTAKPGEIQLLKLRPMNSPLCPVQAIK